MKGVREWQLPQMSPDQLGRFDPRPLVRNPLTYCWIGLLIAFATLYFRLTAIGRPVYEIWFNSDFLFAADVYQDVFVDRFPFSGYRFSIASCLFPDVLVTAVLMKVLGGKALVAAFAYGLFQFTFMTGSFAFCGIVAKVADKKLVVSSVLLASIALTLGTALSTAGYSGMLGFCFITGSQVSSLAMVMLAAGISIWMATTKDRVRLRTAILLFVVCGLAAGSSLLFVSHFLLPWLVTVSVLCYFDIIPFFRVTLTSFFACCGSVCGIIAARLFVNTVPVSGETALDLKRTTDALLVYLRGSVEEYKLLDPLHMVAAVWVLFCISYILRAIRRRLREPRLDEMTRGRLTLFVFMVVSAVGSAVSIIATGIYGLSELKDYKYCMHYQYPLFLGALFGMAYMGSVFFQSVMQQEKSRLWYLRVCATGAMLVPIVALAGSPKNGEPLYRYEPPLVRFLDSQASQYGLTYGVGGYTQSRWISMFSHRGLRAYPVTGSFDPLYWSSDKYWYLGYPKSRYSKPEYNFVILFDDSFWKVTKEMAVQRFGPPAAELKFEETRILVYNRPSDIGFHQMFSCNASWLTVLHPLAHTGDHFSWPGSCLPGIVGSVQPTGRVAKMGVTPPGFLSYGPYLHLAPGDYTVALKYQVEKTEAPSIGTWDAGFFDGKIAVLGSGEVLAADHEIRTRITVSKENADRSFEVRFVYGGRADLVVQTFELVREQ